jgi:hypothetical protein
MNARIPYVANQRPSSIASHPPQLPRFRRVEVKGNRRTYLFVAGEGHAEDLGIWRRYRYYTARYLGREHASEERNLADVAPNREVPAPGVSPRRARECECLPSPGPAEETKHHHQLRSICRLMSRYESWLSNISDLNSSSPI